MNEPSRSRDDAVHILSLAGTRTLCDQAIYRVWSAVGFAERRPGGADGCWECLRIAKAIDEGLGSLWKPDMGGNEGGK